MPGLGPIATMPSKGRFSRGPPLLHSSTRMWKPTSACMIWLICLGLVTAPSRGLSNEVHKAPLVDMAKLHPAFLFDIRYATADNFFGKKAYPVARCLLLESTAKKVVAAQRWLSQKHPGLRLLFKDCYRPDHVQALLWNAVKGTKKARYVANPKTKTGSIHSYGAAVDLTLADAKGQELDMGTPYDDLSALSQPRHEAKYLASGALTKLQIQNRRVLRQAMVKAGGMRMIRNEWWHFNEDSAKRIRGKYRRLNVPLSSVP